MLSRTRTTETLTVNALKQTNAEAKKNRIRRREIRCRGRSNGGQKSSLVCDCTTSGYECWSNDNNHRIRRREIGRRGHSSGGQKSSLGADCTTSGYECWSNDNNRAVIREVVRDMLYVCERKFMWNSIDVGARSAIVKYADDNGENLLFVHSPIELDERTKSEMDKLGTVKHIVSPNYEHVKYAQKWKEAYPNATLWGAPGLKEKKRGKIAYDRDLEIDREAFVEDLQRYGFEFVFFDCESVNNEPFFNECVFVHTRSKSMFVTDVYWNYPEKADEIAMFGWKEKGWKFVMDVLYLPIYKLVLCQGEEKKRRLRKCVEATEALNFDKIVPCHGLIEYESEGVDVKNVLRKHLLLK